MAWLYLCLAGCMEVIGVTMMKQSSGFKHKKWTIGCLASMGISLYLLSLAIKAIPVGTAYAIWTGMGSIGAVIVGKIMFGESVGIRKIVCIACILTAIAGIRLTS